MTKRELAFTKEALIQGLNEDLAAEYSTVIRYIYQSGKAFVMGAELHGLLVDEFANELGHAAFFTDVIADLGSEPVTE